MSEIERNESIEESVSQPTQSEQAVPAEPEQAVLSEIEQASPAEPERYEYRWSYDEQKAFDDGQKKKKRRKGAWTYAITMAGAFLICFAMLTGVLVWYHVTGRSKRAYSSLTVGEVSELVSPATVLIYAYDSEDVGASGTGFFIRSDGYIATNCHVIRDLERRRNYKNFEVTLYSAERVTAELVGYNEAHDLAVLKIKGNSYPTVSIGDSDAVEVGDTAIVIGNPNGAYGAWTTTQGIISAVNRPKIEHTNQRMIQTDAAVNPGNSGGPLCNDRAEVIGIMTQIMETSKGERSEGFGLAIPINRAMKILNGIIERED